MLRRYKWWIRWASRARVGFLRGMFSSRYVLRPLSYPISTHSFPPQFLPHLVVDAHPRRLENIIYIVGYVLIVLYVSRYIRKLRAHSKMGLLVTGIVELTASGIMSVSICWLLGWSLALVPWCVSPSSSQLCLAHSALPFRNLLAFLVLTSGLDNMILVLRAIASTDMNLPVPQRMSIGLRSVGVEMTILLFVEEFMAAALLAFVEIGVMRQWIRFGAVVLVVDFFLELTFFSTILSIDIQRLEVHPFLSLLFSFKLTLPFPSSPTFSRKPRRISNSLHRPLPPTHPRRQIRARTAPSSRQQGQLGRY
jgi:hypothetical protein